MNPSHGAADRPTTRPPALGGRAILPGLAVGHAVFHWIMQSFVVVLPEIQQAFLLSGVGVGGLLAAREVATGVVKLPGGVLVDMVRKYWGSLLAACLAASAVGTLLMGVSPAYGVLLVGMVTVAVSHSVWHLPASASLSHHHRRRRGMALAVHGVGGGVGDAIGPVVTGLLLTILAWRQILLLHSIIPLLVAGPAIWAFRNIGQTPHSTPVPTSQRPRVTRRLLKDRMLWGLAMVYGLRAMALVALLATLPLYLDNQLALSPASRGLHIGLLIVAGLVAKPAAGYLSDRLSRKAVLAPGLGWSALMALSLTVFDAGLPLTCSVALLGLFLYPDQPVLTAAVLDLVGSEVASTALGVVSLAAVVLSTASPLVAGALYEAFGFHSVAYYAAVLFAAACLLFALIPLAPEASRQAG